MQQVEGQLSFETLYMAPDYIAAGRFVDSMASAVLLGDAQKLPQSLRPTPVQHHSLPGLQYAVVFCSPAV